MVYVLCKHQGNTKSFFTPEENFKSPCGHAVVYVLCKHQGNTKINHFLFNQSNGDLLTFEDNMLSQSAKIRGFNHPGKEKDDLFLLHSNCLGFACRHS